ncbi:hypothetical protein ABT288_37015 [Streptomyces sp. NPDC001093]|uniref:hypothetical protein n=1 Tax=Streptomyces sp. NPDC001093 TaxID=3154376 RepID=UPI003322EBB7
MTSTCNTDDAQEETVAARPPLPDPETYIRAYTASFAKARRESRKTVIQQRNRKLRIPRRPLTIGVTVLLVTMAIVTMTIGGVRTVTGLPITATWVGYLALNDVRLSVAYDNPGWRQRHRVLYRLIPRHPLD